MAKLPSEILRKTKTEKGRDKEPDSDKDDKKPRRNALIDFIAKHKSKQGGGDVGKHNNGRTTGFKAVERNASKEYGSKEAGERVAGAVYQKMKSAGKV